ncbi:MAG: hypothetical protein HKP59_05910 [Lutibacter sp.]|uniref:hypothetical protein n=1 Tax=Lutibacter sp. TaxID=1925666 RepID=UPI0017E5325B|nr:hypothetical protein [Lutibacter sp.]MBT8317139.1 hypothetical protein [Lutibacter sp.]NNJ57999.1 hypothetical protein [Lutibacter sp.]
MGTRELIGKIIIQENIDTVDENKIPKTFVINVPDPYKNYYGRFTEVENPNSIIFVTKTPNSFEKILRVTKKINDTYNLQLQGAKCEITIDDRKLNGVRVKGINRYPDIGQIQKYYFDEGYDFAKSEKFHDVDALIRINRFFNIEELEKGIYHSKDEDNTYYMEVPRYMTWADFRKITFEVKNNMSDKNYDIAKGILYEIGGITEILRIVKPKATVEFLKTIQQKYVDRL